MLPSRMNNADMYTHLISKSVNSFPYYSYIRIDAPNCRSSQLFPHCRLNSYNSKLIHQSIPAYIIERVEIARDSRYRRRFLQSVNIRTGLGRSKIHTQYCEIN